MTLAVDFDGTIVEHMYPHIGNPIPHAMRILRQLKSEGCKLILWTCREGKQLQEAVDFLKNHGIILDAVNANLPGTNTDFLAKHKILADYYIDDRNIGGLMGWEDIYNYTHTGKVSYDGMCRECGFGGRN